MNIAIKLLLTVMTIYFAAIPIMVDTGDGHLFNPDWEPHSKVHLVWFLWFIASMSAISLYLLWVKDEPLVTSMIGLSFNVGFIVAYFTAPWYGGIDEPRDALTLSNIPANLAENSILAVMFLAIAIILWIRDRPGREQGHGAN